MDRESIRQESGKKLFIPVVINMLRLNRVSNKQRCICVAIENYCSL